MTDMIDILHVGAFDEMDCRCENSNAAYEPVKCALNKEPTADTRCMSVESDGTHGTIETIHIESNCPAVPEAHHDIFEDYDVLPTILGTGHYGCVRECLHRATGEKYAVKTIDKSRVSRLDHIRREVELLRSVDHPGVMKMIDFYEDSQYVHIITEMYTGGELFDRIVDNTTDYGCLPEAEAMKIIKSLLEAVQYLHSQDIVHRDIKPENVLFESNDEGASIKLIDFGLSRRHPQHEARMSNGVGTPYYMSPGILKGKYDRSCDIWAVGVVAYILLCGYPPFNGSDDLQIQHSILDGRFSFNAGVWGNLSVSSRDFVAKLLNSDESRRVVTAEDALRHPWVAKA